MKKVCVVLVGLLLCALSGMAYADIELGVSAGIEGGTSVGSPALYKCVGYQKPTSPTEQCTLLATGGLDFGILSKDLKDINGNVTNGAGCFYGENYFVVYLFPDAWGGKGYELRQRSATISNSAVAQALLMTPVYAVEDRYKLPDGTLAAAQGALTSAELGLNPQINRPIVATSGTNALIMKARRARIVRAEYGIPPFPGAGDTRPAGWQAVPLTTPVDSSITGKVIFSLTEW